MVRLARQFAKLEIERNAGASPAPSAKKLRKNEKICFI